ncbi:uncharacterized protein LOC127704960 isoform X2 [Mytilus californianus]|uniref:uncharacterized protein LOC127704960 isoform X2 n=1 Tax=Mytilus californianus TaxID=6549 RepID=UPI002245960E|nr:uncharacterized protein LOC127704960 isoform X2 [Mytilus californianus]
MFLLNRRHSLLFGKLLFVLIQIGEGLSKTHVIDYMKENSTAVIECQFKSVSNSITWIVIDKNNSSEKLTLAIDKIINQGFENFKVVGNHTNGEYNLELQRVTKADEKIYKCVSNINKSPHEIEISVLLSTPNDEIKIVNVTESNTVVGVSGISLTLECISVHQHLSNISWSSNGKIISQSQGNLTAYEFIPSEENQNSIYTCTAVYIGKTIRKSVRLNLVQLRYISTTLETIKGEQETITGSSEKNHMIVTTVAIILVTVGILISVYNFRNKGTDNSSKTKDINIMQEVQPGAQGNVQHNQNSSGLVYIEVDFEPKQEKSGPKLFYVHGSNRRSPYADIDFLAKADPLPESESDDNEIEEDDFVTLEDVQRWKIEISE